MKRRWIEYSDRIAHFNAEPSMAQRLNGELIYHIIDATVFIRLSSEPRMVGITANVTTVDVKENEINRVKYLLEGITKVKLLYSS